ncbi:MAG TPA: hypothetical protein VKA46_29930 [Gemmataceae bacterium]|nr:hypothetical protein [Gemmataceae bacterium]
MPLISGPITEHGAVIDVFVGVSRNRQAALERSGLAVPARVGLRVQLDSGSYITGLTISLFRQLGISPIGTEKVSTPSTGPGRRHEASLYDVILWMVSGRNLTPLSVRAIACEDFDRDRDGDVHGIVGRDILDRCNFWWLGLDRRFELGY